ncbi:hypothetical protein [Roseateles asaccharophilus]|uniref:Lipoprotein n=1 Tax=Roseateles asaccharophilus TaxID=582607 RepID=A0ABU2ADY5_9BURK|nr:hypothetical protein [Roseateles asaccharophilus]MDR7334218.1 hypothetical protein [Roseateles asaccharophilus]
MRLSLLLIAAVLGGCASPRWVNPQNPGADLQADTAACERDAERVGRLNQLTNQSAGRNCISGPACTAAADSERMRMQAEALRAQQQCMRARGWREPA